MNPDAVKKKFFNQQAASWDTQSNGEKRQALLKIFEHLQIQLRGWILDVGCGTGIMVPVISTFLRPPGKIIEFDFSPEMLKQNRAHFADRRSEILQVNGDAHFLPFPSQQFNFLICFAVLPHLSNPSLAYKEWHRVLQHSGHLLILHLMSSERLNHFHSRAGEAIHSDYLPTAAVVSSHLQLDGFRIIHSRENENLYLILAQKP